ncbi:hypothetical protein L1987_89499 [Smallanthus sonchifolius]|nr:hypothetical protein L1987_89499 [Smallanthus sonchifolius]
MAVAHRYSVRDFRLLCRLGGAGYRVLARLDHRRPRRYSRLVVMGLKLLSPSYPLDFWLGKGRPLSPEAHGRLVSPKILSLSEAIVNWGTIEPMVSTSLLGKGFPGDSSGSCALEVDMSGCLSAHRSDMRERPCLSAFEGFLLACLLSKLFDPALL